VIDSAFNDELTVDEVERVKIGLQREIPSFFIIVTSRMHRTNLLKSSHEAILEFPSRIARQADGIITGGSATNLKRMMMMVRNGKFDAAAQGLPECSRTEPEDFYV